MTEDEIQKQPFIIYGKTKPKKEIKIQMGKETALTNSNTVGEWIFDLANFEDDWTKKRIIKINGKKLKIKKSKGSMIIK